MKLSRLKQAASYLFCESGLGIMEQPQNNHCSNKIGHNKSSLGRDWRKKDVPNEPESRKRNQKQQWLRTRDSRQRTNGVDQHIYPKYRASQTRLYPSAGNVRVSRNQIIPF